MYPKTIVLFLVLLVTAFAEKPHFYFQKNKFGDFLSLVVGGSEAPKTSYPYIISLQQRIRSRFMHMCAGSILNSQWIITAAHCVDTLHENSSTSTKIDSFIVKAGKHNIKIIESTEQTAPIEQVFIHEKYSKNGVVSSYDIALIKLVTPLKFTKEIQPIELPPPESEPTGIALFCGWGSILSNNVLDTDTLQHVQLNYINRDSCRIIMESFTATSVIKETNICTGPLTGISACYGDSGGPLVSRYGQKLVLTGIASWVIAPCGTYGAPTVHIRVSKFNAWIEQKIANHTTRLFQYTNKQIC